MSLLTRHAKPFSSDTLRQKEQLQEEVESYRSRMDTQIQELQADALEYGKRALVIGGVVAGVYLVMDALLPDEEEAKEEATPPGSKLPAQESVESGFSVGKALRGLAWTLAVGWARQQLTHYIEEPDAQKE